MFLYFEIELNNEPGLLLVSLAWHWDNNGSVLVTNYRVYNFTRILICDTTEQLFKWIDSGMTFTYKINYI